MIPTELLVSWAALVVAAVWIVRQQRELDRRDEVMDSVEEALKTAHETVDMYQHIIRDVAVGHTTLEINNEGIVVATHCSAGKVSVH